MGVFKRGVFKRSGRSGLYVRVCIPAHLQVLFDGRESFIKSLDTSDPSIAELRSRVVDGRASALFLQLQKQGHTMTPGQLRSLVSRYIGERLDEWEVAITSSALDETVNSDWQDCLSAFAQSTADESTAALRSLNSTASPDAVKDFMARYKLTDIAMGSPAYRLLCRELTKAEKVIAEKIKERAQGDYGTEYGDPVMNGKHDLTDAEPDPGPPLSEIIPAYLKHFEHRAPGTIEAKRNVLKRFAEIIGGGKPVSSILKADCVMYRETLRKLPANISKRFPGLSIREVIEKAKGLPESMMLSKNTINQDLTHLGHFFKWMMNEGIYTSPSNPSLGLAYEGIDSESHEEFTDSDLKTIFESREFQAQRHEEPARYWLLTILAYTGARRGEIADLALSDIGEEDGIRFFDLKFDETRNRRLKTKISKRRVPIHSHLLKLGLLDFIDERRTQGAKLLFNTVKCGGSCGDAVSKWFARLLRKLEIPGHKTLHGLRPTVITKLHEGGCDGETRRAIVGHSGKDIHETVYLRLPLKTLSVNLEKLRYKL